MRSIIALILAALLCLPWVPALAEADPEPTAIQSPEPSQTPAAIQTPEPSQSPGTGPTPEPSNLPEPAKEPARLYIDNRNLYEHMTKTYSQGYVPSIENGAAVVVLPLLSSGELQNRTLRAKATFESGGPFVTKNYEQTVELKEHKVNAGKQKVEAYCAVFSFQLESGRMNGSYQVTVTVTAADSTGADIREDFTLYVSVTDGKDPNATPVPEPVPTPEPEPPVVIGPKVLVQGSRARSLEADAQPGVVNAGDHVRVTVTLVNTSQSQTLENMAVTAASPGEGFSLASPSDSVYIGTLAAGGTVDVSYEYQIKPETPAGQYTIPLSYDFAYNHTETGSGTGSARVDVSQPLELEFSMSRLPSEVVVSDTLEVNIQAINLSHAKAYNVRAALEGDGLIPGGTAFIGDLEGGTSGEKPMQVTVTGLTQSETSYGPTSGTITYLYEDCDGQAFTQTGSFTLDIKSPFSESKAAEQDNPGQFWVVMGAVGAALAVLGGVSFWRAWRRRRA